MNVYLAARRLVRFYAGPWSPAIVVALAVGSVVCPDPWRIGVSLCGAVYMLGLVVATVLVRRV